MLIPGGDQKTKKHRPREKERIPRTALQVVYTMACEMAHSTEYAVAVKRDTKFGRGGDRDSQENYFPVIDPKIVEALRAVRQFFDLRGTP